MQTNRKLKVHFPTGYPYVLLNVQGKYLVASTIQQALTRANAPQLAPISPVSVAELIATKGHKDTHQFLASFGKHWMTKDGHVFYPEAVHA